MSGIRYASKVIYYGGYPGSSGRPVPGRLRWDGSTLCFQPNAGGAGALEFDRARVLAVQRWEEGLTGARRLRLLIDVETEDKAPATLKFEMGGLWFKERKLARWLAALEDVCPQRKVGNV